MDRNDTSSPLAPAAFVYAGACIVSLVLLPRLEGPLRVYGAANGGSLLLGRDPIRGILWGLSVGSAAAALGQAAARWTAWGRLFSRLLERWIGGLHPLDALLLAALSGLAEELVFRGLALSYLGLYGSSALFGLAHLIPRKGLWPMAVWAGLNGLALGWLSLATGGLLAPAAAHFVVNGVGLLLLAAGSGERVQP